MNAMNWNEDRPWATVIDEARALLSIIDAEQANEDIDENQVSRQTRLTMRAMAGRLVATIIADHDAFLALGERASRPLFAGST